MVVVIAGCIGSFVWGGHRE